MAPWITNLGSLLLAAGRRSEAEPLLRDAVAKSRGVLGDDHPITLIAIYTVGSLLVAQGKDAETVKLLVSFEAATRKAFTGDNSRRLATFLMTLGKARKGLGEFAAAETDLLEAQPIFLKIRGPKHKDTRECTQAVIDLYAAWNTAERGKGHDTKGAEWKRKLDELGAPGPPAVVP